MDLSEFKTENIKGDYLIYRDKPLVREKNIYCYGDMTDAYILYMMVLSEKPMEGAGNKGDVMIPDRIIAQVLSTDENKPAHVRIAKQFEKRGLYDAIDFGLIWLEKLNK